MYSGPHTEERDAHRLRDTALELGINSVDSANVSGWKRGEGITAKIVGRWFASGGHGRSGPSSPPSGAER